MARLKILAVDYSGEIYRYGLNTLADGLNIIVGDNGTGKSTFCNLIYFGLGGKVDFFESSAKEKHREVTSDKGAMVKLTLSVDERKYVLTRYIGTNEIAVSSLDNDFSDVFSIYRVAAKYTFSDWILEQLGIEPIKIYLGSSDFFLNWSDLLRLIYHNQNNNPKSVYKEPDQGGYMKDSLVIRKIIFETFSGEGFVDLYKTIEEIKRVEKEIAIKSDSKSRLSSMFPELADGDVQTLTDTQNKIQGFEESIEELQQKKSTRQTEVEKGNGIDALLSRLRQSLSSVLRARATLKEKSSSLVSEISSHASLINQTKNDISQLKKIIHVNSQLSLFSPDTCPCCLSPVQRPSGKCTCGADIDESLYQRFFYSGEEYRRILRSKKKNLETVESAYKSALSEYQSNAAAIDKVDSNIHNLEEQLDSIVATNVTVEDIAYINAISDQLIAIHREKMVLEERERVLSEYLEVDGTLNTLNLKLQGLRSTLKRNEGDAETVISGYITKFSEVYNDMCSTSVDNCSSARIDGDYQPIFNNGVYLQDSSDVGKRFCYYLTMLRLSLDIEGSKFPRFLLIDTPESKGISTEALNRLILLTKKFFTDEELKKVQIILSTGLERYPAEFENLIRDRYFKTDRLLKKRAN